MRINPAYPFYNSLLGMLIVCILAQIAIGVMLLLIGRLNVNRESERSGADLLQNICLAIAIVVLILHIMNSSFGIEDLAYVAPVPSSTRQLTTSTPTGSPATLAPAAIFMQPVPLTVVLGLNQTAY